MAGKYVTTSRRQKNPQMGYLDASNYETGNTANSAVRPFFRYSSGSLFYPNMQSVFPFQTTYSYRSVGSPLGPKQDELASILATPQRLSTYSPYDTGHEFNSSREFLTTSHPRFRKTFTNQSGFEGPLYWQNPGFMSLPPFDPGYTGRLLIAQAAPTVPQANLLTTAAEVLREGISLPGKNILGALREQSSLLRGVGGEYLNAQFGWLPLMR